MPGLLVLAFIPIISTSGLVLPPPPTECFTPLPVTNKQSKHYYIDVAFTKVKFLWLLVVYCGEEFGLVVGSAIGTLGSKQE